MMRCAPAASELSNAERALCVDAAVAADEEWICIDAYGESTRVYTCCWLRRAADLGVGERRIAPQQENVIVKRVYKMWERDGEGG